MGNSIGPFLAAVFVEKSTWRGLFWCLCPLAVVAGGIVALTLPASKVHGDFQTKIRVIDYYGVGLSSAAILLLLVPISGGGTYFEWSSPMVISMLVLGSVSVCWISSYPVASILNPRLNVRNSTWPDIQGIVENRIIGFKCPMLQETSKPYNPTSSQQSRRLLHSIAIMLESIDCTFIYTQRYSPLLRV